jgi:hypothetical protein
MIGMAGDAVKGILITIQTLDHSPDKLLIDTEAPMCDFVPDLRDKPVPFRCVGAGWVLHYFSYMGTAPVPVEGGFR